VPDIKKIYLVLRENELSVLDRFKKEIRDKDVFNRLRNKYGKDFKKFIKSKVFFFK
jgi:hypothetical protein